MKRKKRNRKRETGITECRSFYFNRMGSSKVSKITAGKQKLTADDIKTWSRALGYTPDPFVNMSVDLRDYNCRVYLRNVSASLEDYFEKYQDDLPEDMVFKLYRKHQKSLKESGIDLSLTQVLAANGLV